jgi:hypothetical protein
MQAKEVNPVTPRDSGRDSWSRESRQESRAVTGRKPYGMGTSYVRVTP